MNKAHIEIYCYGSQNDVKITMDGEDISGYVQTVNIDMSATRGGPAIVNLGLVAEIEIHGEFDVVTRKIEL